MSNYQSTNVNTIEQLQETVKVLQARQVKAFTIEIKVNKMQSQSILPLVDKLKEQDEMDCAMALDRFADIVECRNKDLEDFIHDIDVIGYDAELDARIDASQAKYIADMKSVLMSIAEVFMSMKEGYAEGSEPVIIADMMLGLVDNLMLTLDNM